MTWKSIALAAGVAGLVAGIALTAIQQVRVVPLLRTAEVLEEAGLAPTREAKKAQERSDTERLVESAVANIVLGTGFALILTAGMTLRGQRGWRTGLAWGVAGYFVFFAAPAIGLPPELPGVESVPLVPHTLWWLFTVTLTALGLWMLVFATRPTSRVAGLVLVAIPHIVGAPHGAAQQLTATHDLANEFITATALANAIFWLMIGLIAGALCRPEKEVPGEVI
jgi:cobalt transporter subunit CbtA